MKNHQYSRGPRRFSKGRRARLALRREVIEAYGGHCACCGEGTFEFLELDHVHNNGAAARRLYGDAYRRARETGYPACYQILCSNCNHAKARFGRCPHRAGAQPHQWPRQPRCRPRGSVPMPFEPPPIPDGFLEKVLGPAPYSAAPSGSPKKKPGRSQRTKPSSGVQRWCQGCHRRRPVSCFPSKISACRWCHGQAAARGVASAKKGKITEYRVRMKVTFVLDE